MPVVEKPVKTFSIKDIISEAGEPEIKAAMPSLVRQNNSASAPVEKIKLTGENLTSAWKEFTESLKGEGARIMSMFKSISPELEDEHTLRIHLSNVDQKDTFVQNYRQKLLGFLEEKFKIGDLEIETAVDQFESNEIIYTDEQKYNYLQAKYPALKDFRKAFNLDIT